MNNEDFTHLHIHNEYSFLDGYGKAEQYVDKAVELGFKHLALTNHGNVDGCIKFQQACKEKGIHPILGAELYIVPYMGVKEKGETRYHINLLCRNKVGWENLLKLLTQANLIGFYHKPRIDPEILLEHLEGLTVLTACIGSFVFMPGGDKLLKKIERKVPIYFEIMPNKFKPQKQHNIDIVNKAKAMNLPTVATNDCHYIEKSHAKLQEVLLAIQTRKKWEDPDRWRFEVGTLYLKTADQMIWDFKKLGGVSERDVELAMYRANEIAERCNLEVKKKKVYLPKPIVPGLEDIKESKQLITLAIEGFEERAKKYDWIKPKYDEYVERLSEELSTITDLGFERYFLIVWELINWCKNNDIMTGPGRGSVGGSLAAYCLGITEIDPIKFDLIFSRFISEARIDLPDIDMDFEDIKRDKILEHLRDLYGEYNVLGVSTFSKMHGRGVLRDVSRVFDLPLADVDKAAKTIVVRSGGDVRADFSLQDALETFEDGIKFKNKYPEVAKIAMDLEGQIRTTGQHAAAMCVSKLDLRKGKNCNYSRRNKDCVANWEKDDAEYMGLMKLDVLGLNALTILNEARKVIKERKGIEIDYGAIDLDDPSLAKEFNQGNNISIFQFGGPSMMRLCRDIGVKDFEDLIALNALHRPGCLRSGITFTYKKRKHGDEDVSYIHPFIKGITEPTYGLILYQEQIMKLMHECGGLQWKTTDMIRKVISKSKGEEQFAKFKKMFIDGCIERDTVPEKEADDIFEQLKYFGSYGFNRAHAAEYAMIAVWEMWLKINYPVEYMMTVLTWGSDDKKNENMQEARRLGISILLPDINISMAKQWQADKKDNLLIPFLEIKGIGETAANAIIKERNKHKKFKSFEEFNDKITAKRPINKKIRELLKESHCFDSSKTRLDLPEEELELLSKYFNFSLSNDPMYRYRKMLERLKEDIEIIPVEEVNLDKRSSKDPETFGQPKYHFGKMVNLKFGYRQKFKDFSKKIAGTSDDLGGVYGDFGDESDVVMLVFGSDVYRANKDEIEHCEGEWILTQARPTDTNCLHTNNIWFAEDLWKGKAHGLGSSLFKEIDIADDWLPYLNKEISQCQLCALRQECTSPVPPSIGLYNMMIVGEAPGYNEDRLCEGFVGDAGDLLWAGGRGVKGLDSWGLKREYFHVTNVCKCYPKATKTPKKIHVKDCGHFLRDEIWTTKPFIILAFGNTSLKFFKNQDTGIMALSGETEWSDEYNCWIAYCVHPASILYSPENKEYYMKGINNFISCVDGLGFGE